MVRSTAIDGPAVPTPVGGHDPDGDGDGRHGTPGDRREARPDPGSHGVPALGSDGGAVPGTEGAPASAPVVPGGGEAPTSALPVELAVDVRHADAVRRWVEGVLGWQPIDDGTAGLVPPAIALVGLDAIRQGRAGIADRGVPGVLVVADDADPVEVGVATTQLRPAAVVGWPGGRDDLASVVGRVLAAPRRTTVGTRSLRVGGAAGGVGTSVVTLALAGLEAWQGTACLAAVRRPPAEGAAVLTAALADPDLWARATPLPGVGGGRMVHLADRAVPPEPGDRRIGTLLIDAGVDPDVDVLVCRRDPAALDALAVTTAAAVVVVGDGPVTVRELAAVAGGRTGIALPWSVRVARADRHGRIPGALPGAWLRRLRPLVPPGHGSPARMPDGDRDDVAPVARVPVARVPVDRAEDRPEPPEPVRASRWRRSR